MGCWFLASLFIVSFITGNRQSFVDTAPSEVRNAQLKNNMTSWTIYNKDNKFEYFSEETEKQWNGPFYFIQGADIQFGFISRELDQDKVITWEKEKILAEDIVERVNKMNPKPRFFVMCGDLCDAMPDEELRKKQEADYKRIFGKLDKSIPLVNVCGNHDVGNTPTPETVQMYKSAFGSDYYSFWCGGVFFIVINSQYFYDPSKVEGLAEKHEKWIDEQLEQVQKQKTRVVVFQHIPWFLANIEEEASYFTLKLELRRKWLNKFKAAGVEAVFCGHYHRNAGGMCEGIDVVVTSAVGGQLGKDKPGARVVQVKQNKIEHTYYPTEDLPLIEQKVKDGTVEELESLKGILSDIKAGNGNSDEISISKSHTSTFSDVNGRKSSHKEIKNEVERNGKMVAKVSQKIDLLKNKEEAPKSAMKTEIVIPSKGIHQVIKNENLDTVEEKKEENNAEFKRARNGIDKMNSFSEIKYSPHDMAEYIFWTGDEKGVALTIEEFLREGLMSRQEAITFLQSIKYNLDLMQSHYQGLERIDEKVSGKERSNVKRKFINKDKHLDRPKGNLYDETQDNGKLIPVDLLSVKSGSPEVVAADTNIKQNSYADEVNAAKGHSSGQEYSEQRNKSYTKLPSVTKAFEGGPINDDDYDEIMERLRVAGLLQKEYSLEEVVFELAKIMFTESLTKGNTEAQKAMQKFSDFLQNQVQHNQISRNLQRKILDVLSSALMDALSERPELLNRSLADQIILDQNSPTSETLKQLLMLGSKRLSNQSNPKEELSEKPLLLGGKKLYKGVK